MLLTIIIFLLVLSVLVLVHEFGHFLTARFFGVKAEEFGLGFPPRAIGWYRNRFGKWRTIAGNRSVESLEASDNEALHPAKHATIYSLNWLPLGGFVKIKGENGGDKDEGDSFSSKNITRRIAILSAGVIMNIVLAWILFSVGYMIGLPQSSDTLGKKARVTDAQVLVQEVLPESAAASAGLKAGDAILRINDMGIETEKVLQDAVAASAGREAELLIKREGVEQTVKVTPPVKEGGRATIGIAIYSSGLVRYPFFVAFWEGAKTTGWILEQIVVAFGNLFTQIFHGDNVGDQFAGPVGIAKITGQAAHLGFTYLLQFMALLSLNLAVINIVPFPALDGGRILFLAIEKMKGKPVRKEVEALIHNIGFLLLIAVIIFVTYKDIIKLF
ncbi:MAG: RIP metalloprotease RseP [Patescibacteria group bacterium]|jgi:regulator of sigma E protease